jgi:hypothetical protein
MRETTENGLRSFNQQITVQVFYTRRDPSFATLLFRQLRRYLYKLEIYRMGHDEHLFVSSLKKQYMLTWSAFVGAL